MQTRLVTSEDYERVTKWWTAYEGVCPPAECLPATGLIVDDIAVAYLYMTNSKLGFIMFPCSNHERSKRERVEGVALVIKDLMQYAHTIGIHSLFLFTHNKTLSKICDRVGLKQMDDSIYWCAVQLPSLNGAES